MRSIQEITEEAFGYQSVGDLERAAVIYDQLLPQLGGIDPNVFYGYGTLLSQQGKYGLAILLLNTAASVYANHAPIWTNLGVCYKHLGLDAKAIECYDRALALEPTAHEVLASLSGYWLNRDAPEKAEAYARQAIAANPTHGAGRMHLGMALLEQSRFEEAWPFYESRWDTPEKSLTRRPYTSPIWDGSPVETLVIHGEQGLGDEILFMSLFHKAQERVGRVLVECATRLVPIFGESFRVPCYGDHQSLMGAEGSGDAHIAMGALPLVLGLPDGKPYLKRMQRPMHAAPVRPRVGIAWKGGTLRTSTRDRTLSLDDFAPILANESIDFVSVQYGGDEIDKECEGRLAFGSRGFEALHHRIASCDLVITVCQTAVHQAGAMGVPCWVLTPRRAAWRYCGTDMMPWYESVSLFRQETAGDWEEVIQRIAGTLETAYARAA